MLTALFATSAHAGDAVVFDRGASLDELYPVIDLREPSAIFTIVPEEPEEPQEPQEPEEPEDPGEDPSGEEEPPAAKAMVPVLVPGTRDGSANLMPSWFPDRSRIAYVSNRGAGKRSHIWTASPTAGDHVQLTTNLGNNLAPALSPDSALIAYLSTAHAVYTPLPGEEDLEEWSFPQNLELYVMNADGSLPRRLTRNLVEEQSPVFSADAKTIYFVSLDEAGEPALYSIPADGEPGDEAPVLNGDDAPLLGTSLSLYGDPFGDILCFIGPSGIYTLYDTFTFTTSTGGAGFVRPHIGEDGLHVVHVPGGNLIVADLNGANPYSVLLTGDITFAQWRSPVGGLTPVSMRVERPNGGEHWPRGATLDILWEATGLMEGPVRIELSRAGVSPKVIAASTPNDGKFEWTITPDIPLANDYIITVTLIADPAVTDSSNANFRISLQQDCPTPARTIVTASDGDYDDRVLVTWQPLDNCREYLVLRNRVNSWSTAAVIATTEDTFFDDTSAVGIVPNTGCAGPPEVRTEYYYWVRGVGDCGPGSISFADTGYRGRPATARHAAGDALLFLAVAMALAAASRRRNR